MTVVESRGRDAVDEVESRLREVREPAGHRGGRGFRPDVEGLRAVAVLLVVAYHAGLPGVTGGYVGVDVFFVISGFLITRQLLDEVRDRGRIRIAGFYARRALRLLPAGVFVGTTTLLAAWLWLPALRFRSVATDALATTFYGMNWRLAVAGTDYLASSGPPSPFQHYWSLAVEEQFYIVWPALLAVTVWLARRRRATGPGQPTGALVTVLLAVIAGSLALSVAITARSTPWAYFGAHTRAWELALGGLLTVAAPRLAGLPRRTAVTARWIGFAALAYATATFTDRTVFPGYAAALPAGAAALVIAAGFRDSGDRLLGAAPMQLIGRLSYPWYLWHWPVLIIAPYVFGDLSTPERLALAGLSFLLAWITSVKVEQPLRDRRALRARPIHGLSIGLALCAGLAAVALLMPVVVMPATTGTGTAVDTASRVETSQASGALEALVAASATVNTVPANLTPTLAHAANDIGKIYFDGCDPVFTSAVVEKPCAYGDTKSATTVVLFGDSHAGHWFPAMDAIARQRHWRLAVVTKSACSAASATVFLPSLNRTYTECQTWRAAALDYIRSLRPAMVVMSSNGHGDAMNTIGSQDDTWVAAWNSTFTAMPAGAKLVLISDTAWPAGSAPDCVSAHLESLTACDRPRALALDDQDRRTRVAAVARSHGATVIDPGDWMCTPTVCPAVIGNVLVWKDDSHMSATFSKLLAPVLGPLMPVLP